MQTKEIEWCTRVESHIFKNNKVLDDLCFKSKNLYNSGLYLFRQELINNQRWLGSYEIYKILKKSEHETLKELPAQVAQQTIHVLDRNIKSYVRSIKDWKKNPRKYTGMPKLPKYLDSKTGRFVFIDTGQGVSRKNNKLTLAKKTYTFTTNLDEGTKINQVRIVPRLGYHKIEVVYQKQRHTYANLQNNKYMGIDIGLNNLMAITTLDINSTNTLNEDVKSSDISFLVKGGRVKSVNQFYNKTVARLKSELKTKNKQYWSKRLSLITLKRNQKIEDYFHKASKTLIDMCLELQIGNIVIGHNKFQKQNINLGKKNNQNIVCVPNLKLIHMIQYKAEEVGIKVTLIEESYTSITDHLASEPMKKHENYLGKRVKRGLFQSSTGRLINADINGAIGILRKVVGDDFLGGLFNRGDVFSPVKLMV